MRDSEVVVLNSKAGADFTCMDCGTYVCASIHHGEPVCLKCNFLRQFPVDRREEIRRRFFHRT